MNCGQVIEENLAEKYLVGALSESEQDAFEQHYFECSSCFEELEKYRLLQQALKQAEPRIRQESLARGLAWRWQWATAAAVVVFAVGLGIWLWPRHIELQKSTTRGVTPKARRPPQLATPSSLNELATVKPPAYMPTVFRGEGDAATQRFRAAMRHYTKADYAAAIPGLRQAAALDPRSVDSRFFLGVCYLLTDQIESAIQALRSAVAIGESAYLEDARFYLAKAYLRAGDFPKAEDELRKTAELGGNRQFEASTLLQELEEFERVR